MAQIWPTKSVRKSVPLLFGFVSRMPEMLLANLTYRQKTISQRFNNSVTGLIVGLLPVCKKTAFKAGDF
ncbi:hypothetical protein [uncultured Alistipes sp.]|uniref:hypothetical protein n=1 Tax=uncultured Alistipes sp. TaxID=538949 RepID=UPI0026392B8C|nr:hypothetical protein [uncultured Alistipes sp.]